MLRALLVGLVVLVALTMGTTLAVSPSPATTDATAATDTSAATAATGPADDGFDRTEFTITIHENGTAVWTFTYERGLENQSDVEHFESFAEEFESEETRMYERFTEQAHALVDYGEEHTDREMDARNFERSARVDPRPNPMGVVEMSFTWDGFAEVDDGTVTVGDVFEGGLYISSDQRLNVERADDLEFTRAVPEPEYAAPSLEDSTSIYWEGERDFPDGQPLIVLEVETDEPNGGTESGPGDGTMTPAGTVTWLLPLALVVALLGLVVAVAWHHTGQPLGPVRRLLASHAPGTDSQSAEDGTAASPVNDVELLADDDRVESLIRENGGRMKQVDIVDETGWSKSKVSMLLSEMEDDGTISKLRVGRENIISLDGFEPEATKSPFEE